MTSNYGALRFSCDACYNSKVKCSRDKPVCSRCKASGLACDYTPGKKPGRRRKHISGSAAPYHTTTVIPQSPAFDVTAQAGDADFNDDFLAGCFFTTTGSTTSLDGLNDPSMMDINAFMDLSETTPESLWMDHFGAMNDTIVEDTHPPPQTSFPFNTPCSMADITGQSTQDLITSRGCTWLADRQHFLQDCHSLSRWSSSSASLAAFRQHCQHQSPDDEDDGEDEHCSCLAAITNLQYHAHQHTSSQPMALDATLYLQRMLLWTLDEHQGLCLSCSNSDSIKFALAAVASQLTTAYRDILEQQAASRSKPGKAQSIGNMSFSIGSTELQGFNKAPLLLRIVEFKLQEMSSCLERFAAESDQPHARLPRAEPLQVLMNGVRERLDIAKGLLQTLRYR